MQLTRIEFVGLRLYSQEQAEAASGLRIGQMVTVEILDAAAEKLLASGLFKNLSYRMRGTAGKAVVVFQVEELAGATPVVFDNFVWFTQEELVDAVRQDLPSFDGTAPDTGGMTETIRKALQSFLERRKIQGRVEYTPSADPSGRNARHIFSVKGVTIPICAVSFPGAEKVKEDELVSKSRALIGGDYSREFVASFAEENLRPVYRERGHLQAAFMTPSAKPEGGASCKDGVGVAIPVEEGPVYNWNKAEWAGNSALNVEDLNRELRMKQGELANGLKIDEGLGAVRAAYGKKGHLMVRLSAKPAFNAAAQTVAYSFTVNEGPQFRMGNFTVSGLSEGDSKNLKERWRLKPGEIYDASYLDEFRKNSILQFMRQRGPGVGTPHLEVKPDRQNLTVEVTVAFRKRP